MKNLIVKIWATALSLMVLVSTSGYHTFQHRCNHYNSVKNSIFLEVDCCNNFTLGHFHQQTNTNLQFNNPACCKTLGEYQKLNFPFEKVDFQKLKNPVKTLVILRSESLQIDKVQEETFNKYSYPIKGPPLVGKQFIFFTQQLKLAPPVC